MLPQPARPLRPVSDNAVKEWIARVITALAREPDFSHPIPHIRAPTLEMAADIIIFLVRWLIEKRPDPAAAHAQRDFDRAFRERFPHPHAECALTTLSRLLRHGSRLDLRV